MHIPKTAGKSIESFFLENLGRSWDERAALLLRSNDDPEKGPEQLAHLTASEYVSLGYLSEATFEAAFRFSFVRNPWARLVSEFHYRNLHYRMTFREFVTVGLPTPGMSDAYRHIVPQHEFLFDSGGRQLVDYIGRFEALQADFDKVCKHLQLELRKLPHKEAVAVSGLNLANRLRRFLGILKQPYLPHYSKYYDSETEALVTAMYATDIETFGYEFER